MYALTKTHKNDIIKLERETKMSSVTQESRYHNPRTALAAAEETSLALTVRRADLYHVLVETVAAAQRHGNFTEHSGVPHRHENGNGAVPNDHILRVGQEAIRGTRQG